MGRVLEVAGKWFIIASIASGLGFWIVGSIRARHVMDADEFDHFVQAVLKD